jgi:hypothetical protein
LYFIGNYEITGLQMKFAPPPIRLPQPQPNDLHFLWLNRVDLRYYWSFNSLLPKNNIEYPQTGPSFHTINADAFSKLKRVWPDTQNWRGHPTLPRSVWKNYDLFSEEKSLIGCQNDLKIPSEMFHNVKLNKLWNNIDWPRKLI